jgi:hypothetical protein
MNTDQTIIGLKTQVSRQVGLKQWEENAGNFNQRHLVNAWKLAFVTGLTDELTEMIWDYILSSPSQTWNKLNSSVFGIYSIIEEYTNKKGYKSLAHFTENKTYLGAVKTMGDKPVCYEGNFRVTRERFSLNLSKLLDIKPFNGVYNLGLLFIPRGVVTCVEPIIIAKEIHIIEEEEIIIAEAVIIAEKEIVIAEAVIIAEEEEEEEFIIIPNKKVKKPRQTKKATTN